MSLLLAAALALAPSHAATMTVEPTPILAAMQERDVTVGDPLRRRLLNSLRPAIQSDLGVGPVEFVVDRLRVEGDWAFFRGSVQHTGGAPIDFSRTRYASALENGVFDGPGMFALLRRSGSTWRVVTFVVGPTDVAYVSWPEEYGVPSAVFE